MVKVVTFVKRKLSGSTLVEVLIAMTVVGLSFAAISLIMNNLLSANNGNLKLKIDSQLNLMLNETRSLKLYVNEQVKVDDVIIDKTATLYENNEKLIWVNLTAKNSNGKKVSEINELIYKP